MLRNTNAAYGSVSRLLHWTIAALFVGQISLGFATQATAARPALQFELFQWHKSTGFLFLVLAGMRLLWSLTGRKPKEGSRTHPAQAFAAGAVHALLLILTLAVPLAGWAIASTSPLRIPSYVFDLVVVPSLPMAVSDAAEAFWSRTHAWLAYGAGILVLAHAGIAIRHVFKPDTGSLHRMMPQRR